MKTTIIYHRDMDGIASAVIAQRKYPDAELRCIDYNERADFEFGNLHDNRIVIVDFSFDNETMSMLHRKAGELIWIDHHKTAKEMSAWDSKIPGKRSIDEAACKLTWQYFNKEDVPYAIELIADWDMWLFKFKEDTKAFHEYCNLFDIEDIGDIIQLSNLLLVGNRGVIDDCIKEGITLLKYKLAHVKRIVKKGRMLQNESGIMTFEVMCPLFISDIGDYILKTYAGVDIAIIKQRVWNDKKDIWDEIVSLRSRKDSDVDVSLIAKERGGGGHKHAAGYVVFWRD